ncbi:MAG TPA: pyridoxal-dependent decarboxylase, partial [Terriglobales bacterium]|nr:pyridoxal-dependent decarboxylase [Terriglobales bacterium]
NSFRQAIAADLQHAQMLAALIDAEPRLERVSAVELSAVCFRYKAADRDAANQAILQRMIRRGRVYLSNATIGGHFALRACFMNHRTTAEDVRAVVEQTLATADELGL